MDPIESPLPPTDPNAPTRRPPDDLLVGGSGEDGVPDPEQVLPDLLDGGSGHAAPDDDDTRAEDDPGRR